MPIGDPDERIRPARLFLVLSLLMFATIRVVVGVPTLQDGFAAHNHAFFFLAVTLAVVVPWAPLAGALALWSVACGLWSLKAVYGGR